MKAIPAYSWASAAADWHLFVGDESALPATFAMTEALPPGRPATLVLEIPEESDEQDLDDDVLVPAPVLAVPPPVRPQVPSQASRHW